MQSEMKPITKESASDKLAEAMDAAIKRLETIQETHAEICLGDDLAHYRTALALYRRIPSFAQRDAAWNTRPTASNELPADVLDEVREALQKAADWFVEYAQSHATKAREAVAVDDREATARQMKAARNQERADYLRTALAKLYATPSGFSQSEECVNSLDKSNGNQRIRHTYTPHPKYPWFCKVCGYPSHELLLHLPTPPEGEK